MQRIGEPSKSDVTNFPAISRRTLLEGSIFGSIAGVGSSWSRDANAVGPEPAGGGPARQTAANSIRHAAAQEYLHEQQPAHHSNGDEPRYPDKRASFAKTLPHNDVGEVDPNAFAAFVTILSTGDSTSFETIPRDSRAEVGLNNPQATYAFDLVGLDGAATSLDPPPTFASAAMATEMAELYWLSLTRDVPFREYETDPLVAAAVSDLNAFTEPLTSSRTKTTPASVFRGARHQGTLLAPISVSSCGSTFLTASRHLGRATVSLRGGKAFSQTTMSGLSASVVPGRHQR
jgi:hypothetical protein